MFCQIQPKSNLLVNIFINNSNYCSPTVWLHLVIMSRDVPRLFILVLKEIAKSPSKYINIESYIKAKALYGEVCKDLDLCQLLIDYITEAGRLADTVIPLGIYEADRVSLHFRNSKLSVKYISEVIDICTNLEVTTALSTSSLIYHSSFNSKDINLSGTFQVDDKLISYIWTRCKNLKSLNIQNCRKVTDKSLQCLATPPSQLNALHVGGCLNLTENGLISFIKSNIGSKLSRFFVCGISISNSTLMLIAKNMPNLTQLGISYANINEEHLKVLLQNTKTASGGTFGSQLEVLHMAWVGYRTTSTATANAVALYDPSEPTTATTISSDFFIDFLPNICPILYELDVSGLKGVNSTSLAHYVDARLDLVRS